ncbi:MAG: phosphatase PAP2 family protein [Gemmatimonadota bacterium]
MSAAAIPAAGPVAAYRRDWLPELGALLALAVAATVVFAVSDLDIAAARAFYRPGRGDPWPVAGQPLWLLFYKSAPWVTGSLAAAGVGLLVAGTVRPAGRRRLHGAFILLCVIVGPGLIVNGILKDHWGRPRPRQIVEFGGRFPYAPPLSPAPARGKSFPCGHCSVGYLYAAGWWLWRRRRPRRAAASLTAGLVLGTLLGIGRMAAGAHFLSDVVWSGLIALGTAHALYYHALRIPAREDSRADIYPLIEGRPRARAAAIAAAVVLGLAIAAGGLFATPHRTDLAARIRPADLPTSPEEIDVRVDTLDVEIRLVADPSGEIGFDGSVQGFGLPTSEILARWTFDRHPVPTLRYRVAETGWFPDIDGVLRIRIPVRGLRRITVRAARGDIDVTDATGTAAGARLPILDLRTGNGRVRRAVAGRPASVPGT